MVQVSGFMVHSLGVRVQGEGLRIEDLDFRMCGPWCMVQSLEPGGFDVEC